MNDINHLLDTLQEGDPVAADRLLVLVHPELRRLAAAKMSPEAPVRGARALTFQSRRRTLHP